MSLGSSLGPTWMGGEAVVGETYVQGKDGDTARALLDAATALGHDPIVVRAVTAGFIVPNDVYDLVVDGATTPAEF